MPSVSKYGRSRTRTCQGFTESQDGLSRYFLPQSSSAILSEITAMSTNALDISLDLNCPLCRGLRPREWPNHGVLWARILISIAYQRILTCSFCWFIREIVNHLCLEGNHPWPETPPIKGAERSWGVYHRPTFLPLPLLISAVSPVCKQDNIRLNFVSPIAQIAPPQLKVLTFNLLFYPNTVSHSNYKIFCYGFMSTLRKKRLQG
jgi:hypothetical protein